MNGRVINDLFPEWESILGGSRIDLNHLSQASHKATAGQFSAYQFGFTNQKETSSSAGTCGSIQLPAANMEIDMLAQPPLHETTAVTPINTQPEPNQKPGTEIAFKTPKQAST